MGYPAAHAVNPARDAHPAPVPPAGIEALDTATARVVGVRPAQAVTDAVGPRHYLHAGPPLELDELPGPMRGALAGALVFEGEAASVEEADALIAAGEVTLRPAHSAGGVGAMAGIVTPHIPVVVVEGDGGVRSFAPVNEGLGQALRFGSASAEVLDRLGWLRDVAAPVLDGALAEVGGIDLTRAQAEGLRRGDECHNRNVASTAALIAQLAPAIARSSAPREDAAKVLAFMAGNPHTFLAFSMAAAKAVALAAEPHLPAGIVTAIAANGRRVSVRVTGTDRDWFTAEAPLGKPKLFEGFKLEDACPMMGDSFMTETVGLGAFALSASPAIGSFVGISVAEATAVVAEMRQITAATSSRFLIPAEEFRGTPVGIDVRKVAAAGIHPVVNNGFAHREAGRGQVGAGMTRLPLEPFVAAAEHLAAAEAQR
jgi:hypothetical protein